MLLLCSHSPNDVPPEPQRNVSIAAVRGAVRPFIAKVRKSFYRPSYEFNSLIICLNCFTFKRSIAFCFFVCMLVLICHHRKNRKKTKTFIFPKSFPLCMLVLICHHRKNRKKTKTFIFPKSFLLCMLVLICHHRKKNIHLPEVIPTLNRLASLNR